MDTHTDTVAASTQRTYTSVSMCPCISVCAHIEQDRAGWLNKAIYRWAKFRKPGGHHGHVDTESISGGFGNSFDGQPREESYPSKSAGPWSDQNFAQVSWWPTFSSFGRFKVVDGSQLTVDG